jgi:nucleotide-binding universal stress UspA family protein
MIKTILVPIGGSNSDRPLCQTALAAARPFKAHLEFFHVRVSVGEAALHASHLDFVQGSALRQAISDLHEETRARSAIASRHFEEFCIGEGIRVTNSPDMSGTVSASWCEEQDHAYDRLLLRSRHCDLTVVERLTRRNGLPRDIFELMLLQSGRPLLVAPVEPVATLTDTIVVAWKETAEAARALTAAMPFLTKAGRVALVEVAEGNAGNATSVEDVARQLAWHGISATAEYVAADHRPIAELIADAAQRYQASLLVMGAYSRGRAREVLFGGCTQALLDHADFPVLFLH